MSNYRRRGGYASSSKPITELPRVPSGPAPGGKRPGAKKMAQSDTVLVDMSPWPNSTSEDWRKEAKILREQRPDAKAAAALCDAVADALEKIGRVEAPDGWVVVSGKDPFPLYVRDGKGYFSQHDAESGAVPAAFTQGAVMAGVRDGRVKPLVLPMDAAEALLDRLDGEG